jgi:hypothetical protein
MFAWNNSLKLSDEELSLVQALLRKSADANQEVATAALHELAKAVEVPLRKGFFIGDTVGQIYTREDLPDGASVKYPIDFVGPSGERNFLAWNAADEGTVDNRLVKGQEITVDTFQLMNAISWKLQYARDARWPMVERALKVFRDGFVHRLNNIGWNVLTKAAGNRRDTEFSTVTGAAFTLGLLSAMQLKMKRGIEFGHSELTDLYVSSEVMKDIRDFATDTSIDFTTRREIFQAVPRPDGNGGEVIVPTIYGVAVHELKQLGIDKDYNTYFNTNKNAVNGSSNLSGFAATTDEVVIGLDLTAEGRNAFFMPVRRDLEMFEDPTLHRAQLAGVYGWMDLTFICLDERRVLAGWIDV